MCMWVAYDVGTQKKAGGEQARFELGEANKGEANGWHYCVDCSVGDGVRVNRLRASAPFPLIALSIKVEKER